MQRAVSHGHWKLRRHRVSVGWLVKVCCSLSEPLKGVLLLWLSNLQSVPTHNAVPALLYRLRRSPRCTGSWTKRCPHGRCSWNGHTATTLVLLAARSDVNNSRKHCALWAAATEGHTATVQALLRAGADIHDQQDDALCSAALHGRTATVQALLAAGADGGRGRCKSDQMLQCAIKSC